MQESQLNYHTPVLLHNCIQALSIKPDACYVDATYGGGGHSAEILNQITGSGKLIAFDKDEDAHIRTGQESEKLIRIHADFRHLEKFLKLHNVTHIDGLLADLGVSSYQFDTADKGFSIRFDAALDMRMNRAQSLTAAQVVNEYAEEKLCDVLHFYGEVRNARALCAAIISARKHAMINTTKALSRLALSVANEPAPKYLAKVFQALRIEVNDEMGALKELLTQSVRVMRPGARLVVISYHSLEDRLVKNFMKHGSFEDEPAKDAFGNYEAPFQMLTKKPVMPDADEQKKNPRSRSAKMRVAVKKTISKNG